MRRMEHAPAGDAGSVTMGAVRIGTSVVLEVVVRAAVLRALPWYRGGMGVTILVTPYGGGQLDIARAGIDGPYRLRARMDNPLDKLPPVPTARAAARAHGGCGSSRPSRWRTR